jgi:hypothetical protein
MRAGVVQAGNSRNQRVSDGTYFYILDIKELGKRTGWIFVRVTLIRFPKGKADSVIT